jgi:hypothetical protein
MSLEQFVERVNFAIKQAETAIGRPINIYWDIGPYDHFDKPRGFGVTFIQGKPKSGKRINPKLISCQNHTPDGCVYLSMRYAHKLVDQPVSRQLAIIYHEIGHAIDTICSEADLQTLMRRYLAWARTNKKTAHFIHLPPKEQAELRADAIAEFIWGIPLRYDDLEVQSLDTGRVGRPAHLGA